MLQSLLGDGAVFLREIELRQSVRSVCIALLLSHNIKVSWLLELKAVLGLCNKDAASLQSMLTRVSVWNGCTCVP